MRDTVDVAAVWVLALLGAMLGVWGSFLVPLRFAGVFGWDVGIAVVGNVGVGLLGALGLGRPAGALAPAVGWVAAVLVLASTGFGGDVIIPSGSPQTPGLGLTSTLFLLVGALAAGAPVVLAYRRFRR